MTTTMDDIGDQFRAFRTEFGKHVAENVRAHERLFAALDRTNDELRRHGEEEKNLRTAVFGNGKPGIDEEVRALNKFVSDVRKLLWILIPPVILGAGAMVWSAVIDHQHHAGG